VVSHAEYKERLRTGGATILEGAQGYSLGIHSGFYPYTTSRECTVAQLCSDTLVSPDQITAVYGCARTYPIRVSNRYTDGMMHGWSGPCYSDQQETSFDALNQVQETTTVTKLPRRVFTFSDAQFKEAVEANMPSKLRVAITFCDYVCDIDDEENKTLIKHIERLTTDAGAEVFAHTWGATHNDLVPCHGS
jgi:adenylosuccinate synthase